MKKMLSVIAFVLMITVVVLPVCQPVDSSAKSFAAAADAPDVSGAVESGDDASGAFAGYAYTQFGAASLGFNYMQSRVSPACANWRRRFNYASSRAVQAAASGTLQEMYYWNSQLEKLNAEQARKGYCPMRRDLGGGSGGGSGSCDRAAYDSCMRDARNMTSPTTGGQTSTGIMMQSQCRQWIAGCR